VLKVENTLSQTLQLARVKLLVGLSLLLFDSKHPGRCIQAPTVLHSICNGGNRSWYNLIILEQVKINCNRAREILHSYLHTKYTGPSAKVVQAAITHLYACKNVSQH
jgi:hypothetical protein